MKVIDVYSQYFAGDCVFNEVARHGAEVKLTATSDSGHITYEISANFFPHRDETDYAISYDAYASAVVYDAPGRRSRKREKALLAELRGHADALAASLHGTIFWERPLREAQLA